MKQGTISVLFGCHSIIHSYWVCRSWHKLYNKWPRPWETVCIIIHDWGHWGRNYLDNEEAKDRHWALGAHIAYRLFGEEGYTLTAGHCNTSREIHSPLYFADKYSWWLAPEWWIKLNYVIEPKINCGVPLNIAVKKFKAAVKANIDAGYPDDTHKIYLDWKRNTYTPG
jgi:hypothetical protein